MSRYAAFQFAYDVVWYFLVLHNDVVWYFAQLQGAKRTAYAYAINVLDQAVADIMVALEEKEMLENSIVVFA